MGSIRINSLLKAYPEKSEIESATKYAREYRYKYIIKYKSSPDGAYTHIADCESDNEIKQYMQSPNCHHVQIIYDQRNDYFLSSKFAGKVGCIYCSKSISASSWPRRGDATPFYYQNEEETKERPGVYREEIQCPFCGKKWFIVWEDDPR